MGPEPAQKKKKTHITGLSGQMLHLFDGLVTFQAREVSVLISTDLDGLVPALGDTKFTLSNVLYLPTV